MPTDYVSSRTWGAVLDAAQFPPARTDSYRLHIRRFLADCQRRQKDPSIDLAKAFVERWEALIHAASPQCREALRWLFLRGLPRCSNSSSDMGRVVSPSQFHGQNEEPRSYVDSPNAPLRKPLLGRGDVQTGRGVKRSDWSERLQHFCREQNLSLKAEQSYQFWAGEFARFLAPRPLEQSLDSDLRSFVNHLRASAPCGLKKQRQCLTALLFVLKECLGVRLSFFDVESVGDGPAPTVLSSIECALIFPKMPGASRLMAELMYASGLRSSELLSLRVNQIEPARKVLVVGAFTGVMGRSLVLPTRLFGRLELHLEQRRLQYEKALREGSALASLPDGINIQTLQRGALWPWQWVFPAAPPILAPLGAMKFQEPVSEAALLSALHIAAFLAGIEKRIGLQTLRYSFVANQLEAGMDHRVLHELLGHTSMAATQGLLWHLRKFRGDE